MGVLGGGDRKNRIPTRRHNFRQQAMACSEERTAMNDTCDMLHHSNSDRVAAGTGIGRESSVLAMISASGARAWEQLVHGPRRDVSK